MKKLIILVLFIASVNSYGQQIIVNTQYNNGVWGRSDTIVKMPLSNTVLKYITGYGTFGSLSDTVRTLFSYSGESYLAYNSATGVFTGSAINLAGSNVTGILTVAKGGTGTATPGLVAGTNVTITGTWPNQTINASGGGGGTPAGSTTWTQYNDAGAFGADSANRWNRTGQLINNGFRTGLFLSPAVTAQANGDTLASVNILQRFNANGKNSLKYVDLKIGSNYLIFDSLYNYSIGGAATAAQPTGGNTVFFGQGAGLGSTNATGAIAIGYRAIYNSATAVKTIAIGYGALATASGMIAIGETSNGGTLAVNSVNVGNQTGGNAPTQANLGYGAGLSHTGTNAINIGNTTGYQATGTAPIYMGVNTGASATGNYNIFSGFNVGRTGFPYTLTGSSNIIMGQYVTAPAASSSNILNIGNVLYGTGLYSSTTTGTQVAQTAGQIGINIQAPATPAALDVTSLTKGFLPPRMTQTQRDAIVLSSNIISLTLVGGTGYTNGTYSISFSGGGGSGAAGTVVVSGGIYSSWVITNYGTGYTSTPTATISAGAGSGGSITVVLPELRGLTIYCTDCTATDASTGVMQTLQNATGPVWKNNW